MIPSTLFGFECRGHTYNERQFERYDPYKFSVPYRSWVGQRPECQWSLFE